MEEDTEVVKPKKYSWSRLAKDLGQTFLLAIVMYLILGIVAQPHIVEGSSMQPNYFTGELVLTNKLPVLFDDLHRGQIVVLQSPPVDPGKQYIKRIIGLPGEKIKIQNDQVIIFNSQHPQGFVLNEPYLSKQTTTLGNDFIGEGQTVSIPANEYVVMGDNRDASYDSRAWGFVSRNDIIGTTYVVYWPLKDAEIVPQPKY